MPYLRVSRLHLAWAAATLLLLDCGPLRTETQDSTQGPAPEVKVPPDFLQIENEVHAAINGARRKFGLAELQMDPALQRVARDYSRRMATQGFFSHTAPNGETASDRFRATGLRYSMAAENLLQNFNVPRKRLAASAANSWLNSPGHRANILRPEFTHTGLGVWRSGKTYYFTQLFIRPA